MSCKAPLTAALRKISACKETTQRPNNWSNMGSWLMSQSSFIREKSCDVRIDTGNDSSEMIDWDGDRKLVQYAFSQVVHDAHKARAIILMEAVMLYNNPFVQAAALFGFISAMTYAVFFVIITLIWIKAAGDEVDDNKRRGREKKRLKRPYEILSVKLCMAIGAISTFICLTYGFLTGALAKHNGSILPVFSEMMSSIAENAFIGLWVIFGLCMFFGGSSSPEDEEEAAGEGSGNRNKWFQCPIRTKKTAPGEILERLLVLL